MKYIIYNHVTPLRFGYLITPEYYNHVIPSGFLNPKPRRGNMVLATCNFFL